MKKICSLLILAILFSQMTAFAEETVPAVDPVPDPTPAEIVLPEITEFSPSELTAGETELTITGSGFGSPFNSPENQICFGASDCYDATGLNDYLLEWSDTQIRTTVPPTIAVDSNTILVRVYFPDTETFDYIESAGSYTVNVSVPDPEPLITSFDPSEVVPGTTVMTISGEAFGDSYDALIHQICFGSNGCIEDADMDTYLVSWADDEIQVTVPAFVTVSEYMTVYAYSPLNEAVIYVESSGVFTIYEEPEPDPDPDPDPDPELSSEITSFSPELLMPEETVVISGVDFGDSYVEGSNEICFGTRCMTSAEVTTYLTSWTDTEIQIVIPDFVTIPDKLKLKINDSYIYSDNYHVIPLITSFTPTALQPEVTSLTISGYEFGAAYVEGSNQICFENDGCISDDYIDEYLVSWADTSIEVLVPEFVENVGRIGLVVEAPTTDVYGLIYSEDSFTLSFDDPEITSLSHSVVVPGDTVLTINGEGFGDTYVDGSSQVCFNNSCLLDSNIDYYLESWSDTKIVILIPDYSLGTSATVSLRVPFSSTGFYDYVESSSFSIRNKPVIEWYYDYMEQGGRYTYTGYYFGTSEGKVVINGQEANIYTWTDEEIVFDIPDNASGGKLYIETADDLKSDEVDVMILDVTTYSNDEYSRYQWNLGRINIKNAWGITEGDDDVIVAVIDTGVDINHEDLEHSIWQNPDEIVGNGIDDDGNGYIDDIYGWDFVADSNSMTPRMSHGTMVASVIAAEKDNGLGISGVAPGVTIMALNIANFDYETIGVDAAIEAIKYAVDNGADIINMSFGGLYSDSYYEDAAEYAYDNNVLLIASTGNEAYDLDDDSSYGPACTNLAYNMVLGIASSNYYDLLSNFSNYGSVCTDFIAPGEDIPVAVPDGDYSTAYGTSFSAPLVAGVAALIKSEHPDWNVEQIKYVLEHTADNIDSSNSGYSGVIGAGIPDAYSALRASTPSVSYTYNPRTDLVLEETGATIEVEEPETDPIEDDEPVKNESEDDDVVEKDDVSGSFNIDYESSFFDVGVHEYKDAIAYLENIDVIDGYPDGTFKPDHEINRAEFTKIVVNALVDSSNIYGTYCFPDVTDDWYAPYVCTAKRYGIVSGYPDGYFRPANNVNLVESLKIVLETYGVEFESIENQEWYAPYVLYIIGTSLEFITLDNSLSDLITRAEMSELIYLLFKDF